MRDVYEITYDWQGEFKDVLHFTERFEGSREELNTYIKVLRKGGHYNIRTRHIDDYKEAMR